MPDSVIRDILINARQESFRMQHYYLGVEHLFIGLLEIPGGLTASVIESGGLTTEYVIDLLRRQTGKGPHQRRWPGMPNTPRADIVLGIANDLALDEGRPDNISERDMLLAILEESDSIPVRVLRRLGFDLDELRDRIQHMPISYITRQLNVEIVYAAAFQTQPGDVAALTDEHLLILRRMFAGYSRVRIERRLTGGYSPALLLVATPMHPDGQEDAAVVVKIDHADQILDEAQRYDTHVKNSLPPLTARLEDRPTTAEISQLAGLKYTFVAGRDTQLPQDLRAAGSQIDGNRLGAWLKTILFPNFGKTWWMQRRLFRFTVWTEYDWLLPPLLTLDYVDPAAIRPEEPIATLRDPVRRNRIAALNYGALVQIEDFVVQKIYRERGAIQLALGKGADAARRAYKIELRGVNLAQDAFYRGEIIEQITGRIVGTRAEALQTTLRSLKPPFDPLGQYMPGLDAHSTLPNPIVSYDVLLDQQINGALSKIHGDLHLGNILIGIHDSPFLIDFALTRDGHTAFDWACLEISLLRERVVPVLGANWEAVWGALKAVDAVHRGQSALLPQTMDEALRPVAALQEMIDACLIQPGHREEFQVALALAALRAMTWGEMAIGGQRLMVGLAGLCLHQIMEMGRGGGPSDTLSADATDLDT